jgi:hypothetical protein
MKMGFKFFLVYCKLIKLHNYFLTHLLIKKLKLVLCIKSLNYFFKKTYNVYLKGIFKIYIFYSKKIRFP